MKVDYQESLDKEEKLLIDVLESKDFTPKSNKQALRRYKRALTKRISINVQEKDIEKYKEKAQKLGIPYQTLISSVLHRYIENSHFRELF